MADVTAADLAKVLRKDAQRGAGKGPAFRIARGWKFGLSFGPVPMESKEVVDRFKQSVATRLKTPEVGKASYEQLVTVNAMADATGATARQWILSASLHPRGRSSTEQDWRFLGEMIGALGAPPDSLRTPFESTNPNDVHYWLWDEPEPKAPEN